MWKAEGKKKYSNRALYYHMVFHHNLTIKAQLWLTYLPLSLRTNVRQAPLLRVIPSDRFNQSVLGLGLGCHQTGWSFHLKILGSSEKTPERSWEGSERNTLLKKGLVAEN